LRKECALAASNTVLACASISVEVSVIIEDLVVLFVEGPPGIVGEGFLDAGVLEPKLMLRVFPVFIF
jgi:hypothetical protein